MTFALGENVGPYRVIEQLGQGGMATVYKAYHAALDRYVAIKVLHPAFLQDPNFLKRFEREARAVARLEHPNIVPVYDFAEQGGQPYLVMKYIEGDTLKARLRQGPILVPEGLRIVEAAGGALAYAHKRGVLHRDIKPSNILLAPEGEIYLADFGLARIGSESTLSADVMMGTPQYISPEQARGDKELDSGTDIYSFGVVVYEIVVGRVPFNADTPFSIIHDHIYKPLPLPSTVNPRVPLPVERVLLKSLAKDSADRFKTVEAMVQAFRSAVTGQEAAEAAVAVAAVPPRPPSEATKVSAGAAAQTNAAAASPERPRRRWLWVAGGLTAVCLCLLAFLSLANRGGEDDVAAEQTSAAAQVSDAAPSLTVEPSPTLESRLVLEARRKVLETPEDPAAHLALAEALRANGSQRPAMDAYLQAAELFLQTEAPLDALLAVQQAAALAGGPTSAGPRLENLAVESAFLAADNPGIVPLLGEMTRAYPNWASLPAISARAALYLSDRREAERQLEVALNNQPGDPLARAVRAEALYLQGEPVQAQAFARQILEQPRLPDWLVEHLKRLIASPPSG